MDKKDVQATQQKIKLMGDLLEKFFEGMDFILTIGDPAEPIHGFNISNLGRNDTIEMLKTIAGGLENDRFLYKKIFR